MISDLALSCSMRWPAAYCPSGSRLAASTEVSRVEERATATSKTVIRIPALNSDILGESEVDDEDALHFLLLKTLSVSVSFL
jgi:hypothetical protein